LNWLKEKENYEPDYIMVLQPTAPLRQDFHIKEAIELYLESSPEVLNYGDESKEKQFLVPIKVSYA